MPKEVITSGIQTEPKGVHIGWRKGSDVQLATVRPDGESETDSTGEFIDLDRHAINEIIRVLRRARDQAFGRDE